MSHDSLSKTADAYLQITCNIFQYFHTNWDKKFDCAVKRSKPSYDHPMNKFGLPGAPDAIPQVLTQSFLGSREKDF